MGLLPCQGLEPVLGAFGVSEPADPFLSCDEFYSWEVSLFLSEGGTRSGSDPTTRATSRVLCCRLCRGSGAAPCRPFLRGPVSCGLRCLGSPPCPATPTPGSGSMAHTVLALLRVPGGQLPLSLSRVQAAGQGLARALSATHRAVTASGWSAGASETTVRAISAGRAPDTLWSECSVRAWGGACPGAAPGALPSVCLSELGSSSGPPHSEHSPVVAGP